MSDQITPPTLQDMLLADLFHPSASRSPRENAAMMEIIDLRNKIKELEGKSQTESGVSRPRSKRAEVAEEK
jgi:hypothetical protein